MKQYWFMLILVALLIHMAAPAPRALREGLTTIPAPGAGGQPAAPASAPLLQFTAGGHILGFQPGGLYVASATHALQIAFQGANTVTPTASQGPALAGAAATRPLAAVTWTDLWDGITLTYRSTAGAIAESVYTLAPGAAVERIRLAYNVPASLNPDGSLTLSFETGQITETAPAAWQEIAGQRVAVAVAFNLNGTGGGAQVGYTLGRHDPTYAVTIDPQLIWTDFLGSVADDTCKGITLDSSGNIYIVGESVMSWGTPRRGYSWDTDAYVAKLSTTGVLLWNTFLGGYSGDLGNSIYAWGDVIFVAGTSSSAWGTPPYETYKGSNDAWVARLDGNGDLVWNAFLGGNGNDYGQAVAVSSVGWVYVAGISYATWGTPARAFSGGSDTFVASLMNIGALGQVTFLGGAGDDEPIGLVADAYSRAYVTGLSTATWGAAPKRAYSGGDDAYVAKVNFDGTVAWNTFLGGSGDDQGNGIDIDTNYNVYVAGSSYAAWGSLPVQPFAGAEDAFAAKLDSSGTLAWFTFMGGDSYDMGAGIALDSGGYVYITGACSSGWGTAPANAFAGSGDIFVVKLDSSGRQQWNTFWGGTGSEGGSGIVVSSNGLITLSAVGRGAWGTGASSYQGGLDGLGVRLDANGILVWNRFLGAGGDDAAMGVVIDSGGNIIVTGSSDLRWPLATYGAGQPVRDHYGRNDAFVAKLSPAGGLLWHTFLGGILEDYGKGVTVDSNGYITVVGFSTGSWGAPLRPYTSGNDAFVAEVGPGGVLQWNAFLGGSGNDVGFNVAVDGNRNVFVAGQSNATWGSPLRAYSSGYDGFAARLNANGGLVWNAFLGGAGNDYFKAIAVQGNDLYLAGDSFATWGSPARAYTAGDDGVVVRLNTNGTLIWNVFLGGAGNENITALVLDASGNIYVAGSGNATWGAPVRPFSGYWDISAARLYSDGTLAWNTFLGGAGGDDFGAAIALGDGNKLLVTGSSSATWGSPDRPYSALDDAPVVRLSSSSGTLLWQTFLGGNGYDYGNAIAVSPTGVLAVAGSSDRAWGDSGPGFSGGQDAFVTTIRLSWRIFMPALLKTP